MRTSYFDIHLIAQQGINRSPRQILSLLSSDKKVSEMTRGNQRDKAREKAMKQKQQVDKQKAAKDKAGNKGTSLEERRHRDAEIMRQKQLKKSGGEGGDQAGASASK